MTDALERVKDFLASPTTAESRTAFLDAVPLEDLVGLLGSGNASTEESVCQALSKLLSGDHADSRAFLLSPQGSALVPAGLSHGSPLVRKTTLELLSSKTFDEAWIGWLRQQGFLRALLEAVVDRNLQVSTVASSALLKAAATPIGREGIFVDNRDRVSAQCCDDADTTVQLRMLELVCKIWQLSPECAEMCKATPARGVLVGMIDLDDILLQLNAVEIISLLPAMEIGKEVMPKLAAAAEMGGEPVVVARLLECLCRFIAEKPDSSPAAAAESNSAELEATLHRLLLDRFAASNPGGDQGAADALSAVAVLCSTPPGFVSLAHSPAFPRLLPLLPPLLQSLHHPSRLAALEASLRLLQHAASTPHSSVCEPHFLPLAPFLLSLARGPVPEQKIGALCLARALALHSWGLRALFAQSDFLSFITDRKAESFKRALDEKFAVARTAAAHPDLLATVGQERADVLRAFVAQGAYYTPNDAPGAPNAMQVASEHL